MRDTPRRLNAALIAGVVNAHTHLEFSDLQQPLVVSSPFTAWIRVLLQHRRTRNVAVAETIATGLQEVTRNGTTLVGEINTTGDQPAYHTSEARCVVFRELIGLSPETISDQLQIARDHLELADDNGRFLPALSPHAPYSVHPTLLEEIVQISGDASAPIAMHLAETLAERDLLENGTGEFRTMLEEFGIFSSELFGGRRPLDELRTLAQAERALVIHGNYLDDDEIEFLTGQLQMSVVYCPRTHAYFGHQHHPWRTLIDRGVRVALGTDSRASNPDLSVWEEAKFLRRQHPDFPPQQLLQMATINGEAALLGEDAILPELEGRTVDDLSVIELPHQESRDPYGLLFHPSSRCRSLSAVLKSVVNDQAQ
ncbi:amidohydrolase family protein [Thalassoroseus pseudoceratinae]|uniref:amidohydrolase family protein n=1 Tax=Thalassoroseus pseudoceratinae TaxID=2713176 RepID=UPI00141F4D3E|nr:amidohydrolase family protein [Thalassoroseus pseudoceratinae]